MKKENAEMKRKRNDRLNKKGEVGAARVTEVEVEVRVEVEVVEGTGVGVKVEVGAEKDEAEH